MMTNVFTEERNSINFLHFENRMDTNEVNFLRSIAVNLHVLYLLSIRQRLERISGLMDQK